MISRKQDLLDLVEKWGVVPFFKNPLPGFSVAETCDPALWFTETPGPWEWKGPVIRETGAAYGKFLHKKAAWVRKDLYCHLANFRRDGYDFDARWDDGLASRREKRLYDLASSSGPALSTELRARGGYTGEGRKEFDPVLTALQMEGYLLCSDFVYSVDKKGKPYGWGVAEVATPEAFYGEAFARAVYGTEPEQSARILTEAVQKAAGCADRAAARLLAK